MLVYFVCKITIERKWNWTPDISIRLRGRAHIPLRKYTDSSLRCPSKYYFLSKNSSAPRVQNNKTEVITNFILPFSSPKVNSCYILNKGTSCLRCLTCKSGAASLRTDRKCPDLDQESFWREATGPTGAPQVSVAPPRSSPFARLAVVCHATSQGSSPARRSH